MSEWNIDIAYQRLCVCGKITHVGGREGADVRGRKGGTGGLGWGCYRGIRGKGRVRMDE